MCKIHRIAEICWNCVETVELFDKVSGNPTVLSRPAGDSCVSPTVQATVPRHRVDRTAAEEHQLNKLSVLVVDGMSQSQSVSSAKLNASTALSSTHCMDPRHSPPAESHPKLKLAETLNPSQVYNYNESVSHDQTNHVRRSLEFSCRRRRR